MILVVAGALAAIALVIGGLGLLVRRCFPSFGNYGAAGGNALLKLDTFFRPSSQHVIDAKEHEQVEEEDSGDPPHPV
jgi:hypothetical protein